MCGISWRHYKDDIKTEPHFETERFADNFADNICASFL